MNIHLFLCGLGVILRGSQAVEVIHFYLSEAAVFARREVIGGKPGETGPMQSHEGQSVMSENALDLAVFPFGQNKSVAGSLAVTGHLLDLSPDFNAASNDGTRYEPGNGAGVQPALHFRQVALFNAIAGMSQQVGQLPVIGDEQGAGCIPVQSANGKQAPVIADKFHHRSSFLGVGNRTDNPRWFVEQVDHLFRLRLNRAAIHFHQVFFTDFDT